MSLAQDPSRSRGASGLDYGRFSHASTMAVLSMASTLLPRRGGALFSSKPVVAAAAAVESSFHPVVACEAEIRSNHDGSPHLPVQRIGAGLANLGNTCFLNAVLQCLTYTPPLAARLQSGFHQSSCRITSFCAMCALESHVKEALASHGRSISPKYLVKNLRCISRSFQMWRQEDAHEYMRYLIEALQKCCLVEASSGKSLIQNVFGGQLRSQVKCTQCSHCSNKYDPFLDLSLEVEEADSLQTALAHFTAIEELDGDNKYQCSKCRIKVRALKQFTIDKAPPVLTIQLKRFSSLGGYGGKIDKKIHFDKHLDLKPFVNGGEGGNVTYSLYAVLVHSGWSINSGHYYCFVRTAMDIWYLLDDNQVSKVSERTVLEQKAYILLYMRDEEVIKSPHPEKFPRAAGHSHQGEEAAPKRASVRNRATPTTTTTSMHSEMKFQVADVSQTARSSEALKQSAPEVIRIGQKKEGLEGFAQNIVSHPEISETSEPGMMLHSEDVSLRRSSCEADLSEDAERVPKPSSAKISPSPVKGKSGGSDLVVKRREAPEPAESLSVELVCRGCNTVPGCEWATCTRCTEEEARTFDDGDKLSNKTIEDRPQNKCINDDDARISSGLPVLRHAGRSSNKGSSSSCSSSNSISSCSTNSLSLDMAMEGLEAASSEKGEYNCRKLPPIWDNMSWLSLHGNSGKSFLAMAGQQASSMLSECAELFLWSCFRSPF